MDKCSSLKWLLLTDDQWGSNINNLELFSGVWPAVDNTQNVFACYLQVSPLTTVQTEWAQQRRRQWLQFQRPAKTPSTSFLKSIKLKRIFFSAGEIILLICTVFDRRNTWEGNQKRKACLSVFFSFLLEHLLAYNSGTQFCVGVFLHLCWYFCVYSSDV